jgi:uncharacterized protein YjbJ (UPF0337 family)
MFRTAHDCPQLRGRRDPEVTMNKSKNHPAANGTASMSDLARKSAAGNDERAAAKTEHQAQVPPGASEQVRPAPPQATPRDAAKPVPATPANEPLRAARGDDDLMSKQQQQSMPSVDALKGRWKQHVGSAKIAWGKLSEDELLKSEGHEDRLAGLVQERYAVSRDEAGQQVKSFFKKHNA